ncbi:hypothetical protein [Desulfobacula phenolica]|uniref:Uncharacterized protein n=1 Tax=Desulfobacula phenolica TaxID=90732 RepID=A0A1H2JLS0_9BACT|nr:hypothetical protein [Desulfobacula phenolica]SDU57400.1 hypothetical protein SAMN04487931_11393 [Desulfobacula phenolica]
MDKHQTSINGIIIPVDWNTEGKALKIAIVTFDEDTVMVADNACCRSLMNHIRKTVTVSGEISIINTVKKMRVEHFEIHQNI